MMRRQGNGSDHGGEPAAGSGPTVEAHRQTRLAALRRALLNGWYVIDFRRLAQRLLARGVVRPKRAPGRDGKPDA